MAGEGSHNSIHNHADSKNEIVLMTDEKASASQHTNLSRDCRH